MKLVRFALEIDGKLIREVLFRDNLNIITNDKRNKTAGNSVGKSTLGRVLDYLFDGSLSPIYIDEEFGTPNNEIETLFSNKTVYASLEYIGINGVSSSIKRQLSTDSKSQSYYVENKEVNKKIYVSHIMETVFNVYSEKPTIRKLAPKFFRTNQHRMLHTVKFDNGKGVSDSDISTVFLYLFGFNDTELLSRKHKLQTAINRYSRQVTVFNSVISEQKIIGSISEIKKEIKKLEKSLLSTDKGVDKLGLVNKINNIDDEQNILADKILTLDLKIKNIKKTNELLVNEEQQHLIDELRSVYEYASVKIESVLNDYESLLAFHNKLVNTKKEFISEGLEDFQKQSNESNEKIRTLSSKKEAFYSELKSKKKIEDLSETVNSIGELSKELIKHSAVIEQKNNIELKRSNEVANLDKLSIELEKELENVELFEKDLIINFNKYTKIFYGVGYDFSLKLNKKKGECSPSVDDIQSNNEGGLKRLEVIIFDLSYIKTVCDKSAHRPSFVLHDSIDDIDIKHIKEMFKVSISLSGQHVLSMLSDKLPEEQYEKYKEHIILELSQDDKFFRV